jgi:hypothetical protein
MWSLRRFSNAANPQLSMSNRLGIALCTLCLTTLFLGCGGERAPEFVPVEGVVSLNGQPKGGLFVRFSPEEAKGNTTRSTASGTSDAQGKFKLQYEYNGETGEGAAVGWYRVTIADTTIGYTAQGQQPKPPTIPPIYSSPAGSPLEVEVKSGDGPQAIDLDVKK